jgi:hypothetical protein
MVNCFNNRLLIEITTKKRCCKNYPTNNASDNSQTQKSHLPQSPQTRQLHVCVEERRLCGQALDYGFSRSICRFEWRGGQVPACADEGGTARCTASEILRQDYRYTCNAFSTETSFASALSYPSSVSYDSEEAFKDNSKATITLMSKLGMKYLM